MKEVEAGGAWRQCYPET